MKVTFEVNEVLPKLVDVASVINSKNSMAILSDFCITVSRECVIITASDGENWVTERADVLASDMEATFCTVAKDLLNCLKTLSDENVTITLDEESSLMTLDYMSGKISLPYETSDDFPKPSISVDGASEVIMNSGIVRNVIKIASTSTENSVVRPIMNGVHFGFSDGKMTVNGASHLRVVKLVEEATINDGAEFRQFTIPPKASSVITSVLDGLDEDVKIRFTDKAVSVSNKNFKITARLLEGKYPDCEKVIPKDNTVSIEVDKDDIVNALRHVLSIDNANRLVSISVVGGTMTVSAEDINYGRTSEENISCNNYTQNEISICFNGEVMSEIIRSIDDEKIIIEMSESTKPAVISSNDKSERERYISVIMPMVMQSQIVK